MAKDKSVFTARWTKYEIHKGVQIFVTKFFITAPIYGVRIGMDARWSVDLAAVRNLVDEYYKAKLN